VLDPDLLSQMSSYDDAACTHVSVRRYSKDLGDEWTEEMCKLVPEIYGPWSDESTMAKTTELTDKVGRLTD
jgi:hypothetical protein